MTRWTHFGVANLLRKVDEAYVTPHASYPEISLLGPEYDTDLVLIKGLLSLSKVQMLSKKRRKNKYAALPAKGIQAQTQPQPLAQALL